MTHFPIARIALFNWNAGPEWVTLPFGGPADAAQVHEKTAWMLRSLPEA